MAHANARLVGGSFRMGYRFQRYWGTSIATAFFFAEAGTGLFLLSYFYDHVIGMLLGLLITGTLKPYFHLAHMGRPQRSWRAILRPDRSWISRGSIAIAALLGCGTLVLIDRVWGLPAPLGFIVGHIAAAGAMVMMCYQGLAMADSDSLALWASPFVPLASFTYALTAGTMLLLVVGWDTLGAEKVATLSHLAVVLLLIDLGVVIGILLRAREKSPGGAFSVEMLLKGEYAGYSRYVVGVIGLAVPFIILTFFAGLRIPAIVAAAALLAGFFTLRLVLLRAAVFEPISHDIAGSIGLR